MKSLLQEAPSIERAISQAWESAGRPQEFSVKIHEQGKRGFLGFSSKPAVVSITYKPLVAPGSPASAQSRAPRSAGARNGSEHGRDERRSNTERSDRSERTERADRPDRAERPERPERPQRPEPQPQPQRAEPRPAPQRTAEPERAGPPRPAPAAPAPERAQVPGRERAQDRERERQSQR